MVRNRLNYCVDALALLGLLTTGWVIHYTLPAGTGGRGRGVAWTLWGWTRHNWGDLHFWLAIGVVGLLLVHVVLHWGWVCATTQSLLRARSTEARRLGTTKQSQYKFAGQPVRLSWRPSRRLLNTWTLPDQIECGIE